MNASRNRTNRVGRYPPFLEPLEKRTLLSTVGYWRFEEGATGSTASGNGSILDSSGNKLNGTPAGGPIYTSDVPANPIPQTGAGNQHSLAFNGGQNVFVPDNPLFYLTHSLTLEAYIKAPFVDNGNEHQIVFRGDNRNGMDPYFLEFDSSGSYLQFVVENATGQAATVKFPYSHFNTWTEVAATLDDSTGTMSLYINGVLAKSINTTIRPFGALLADQTPGIGIGALEKSTSGEYFYGDIDEVRISNVALTPSDFLSTSRPRVSSFVLNDGATQRSIVNKLTVAFSTGVTLAANAITLMTKDGTAVPFTLSTADGETYVLTFTGSQFLAGSLADGQYVLTVHAGGVIDVFGQPMAADQSYSFFRFFGDINSDGIVNNLDYLLFKKSFLFTLGQATYNADFDYDGNGTINNLDYLQFKARFLKPLPG